MINNNCNRLVNTFGSVEDKELDMIGCSLIIVLRDILMCSILATTCMQGLFINCLEVICSICTAENNKERKRTKIRNRYNQAPHLTQGTNGKVTTTQLYITNEPRCQPFPSRLPQGINKRAPTKA